MYDNPSITADINSLYPSAMKFYEYPCGKRSYYNKKRDPEKMEIYKRKLNNKEEIKLSNLRIKYKVSPKCLIQMLPEKV